MDSKAYWVGFNLIKGIGAVRMQALLDRFGDLSVAWNASGDEFRSAGLPERIVQAFFQVRRQVDLERVWERIRKANIQVLIWDDPEYPRLLKEIDQPPPVLYVRGALTPEDDWAVGIVGTRRVTSYGRQITEELSAWLAANSVTVVSGLARGVDALAHQAALRAGGRTVAVLGCGVDRVYPPEHRRLYDEIIERGAVISDYPVGTPPESSNFPPRNRIISGLSRAVVVVEAGESSGALITASFAADQGRDVLAVPGSIYAPQSKGTNRLIQHGARPLLNPDDLVEVLDLQHARTQLAARVVIPADEVEAGLYRLLGPEPQHIDDISARSGLPVEKVSATLTLMELKGLVRHVGGMSYVTIREELGSYSTDVND